MNERLEVNTAGVQERHLTFALLDRTGKKRELDSARFGPLSRSAIQNSIDEQNRDRDKDDLRRTIDQGIAQGLQPDQLAKFIKDQTDFDTKTSLRKIGEQTHTLLTFSRIGQVTPLSNNHLETQYSTQTILTRCQQANPKGYAQYIDRIEANKLEYPIQINDRGLTTKSAITRDLVELRDQSRSLPHFLATIARDGRYKWTFLDFSGGKKAELHQDLTGTRPIDEIAFGVERDAPFYSGISLDKQLSYPALSGFFSQPNKHLSLGSGSRGGDLPAKNTSATEDQKPRILSTAGVGSAMEAQQVRIHPKRDEQAAPINKQERDANAIDRRASQGDTVDQSGLNEAPEQGRRLLKKRGQRF